MWHTKEEVNASNVFYKVSNSMTTGSELLYPKFHAHVPSVGVARCYQGMQKVQLNQVLGISLAFKV